MKPGRVLNFQKKVDIQKTYNESDTPYISISNSKSCSSDIKLESFHLSLKNNQDVISKEIYKKQNQMFTPNLSFSSGCFLSLSKSIINNNNNNITNFNVPNISQISMENNLSLLDSNKLQTSSISNKKIEISSITKNSFLNSPSTYCNYFQQSNDVTPNKNKDIKDINNNNIIINSSGKEISKLKQIHYMKKNDDVISPFIKRRDHSLESIKSNNNNILLKQRQYLIDKKTPIKYTLSQLKSGEKNKSGRGDGRKESLKSNSSFINSNNDNAENADNTETDNNNSKLFNRQINVIKYENKNGRNLMDTFERVGDGHENFFGNRRQPTEIHLGEVELKSQNSSSMSIISGTKENFNKKLIEKIEEDSALIDKDRNSSENNNNNNINGNINGNIINNNKNMNYNNYNNYNNKFSYNNAKNNFPSSKNQETYKHNNKYTNLNNQNLNLNDNNLKILISKGLIYNAKEIQDNNSRMNINIKNINEISNIIDNNDKYINSNKNNIITFGNTNNNSYYHIIPTPINKIINNNAINNIDKNYNNLSINKNISETIICKNNNKNNKINDNNNYNNGLNNNQIIADKLAGNINNINNSNKQQNFSVAKISISIFKEDPKTSQPSAVAPDQNKTIRNQIIKNEIFIVKSPTTKKDPDPLKKNPSSLPSGDLTKNVLNEIAIKNISKKNESHSKQRTSSYTKNIIINFNSFANIPSHNHPFQRKPKLPKQSYNKTTSTNSNSNTTSMQEKENQKENNPKTIEAATTLRKRFRPPIKLNNLNNLKNYNKEIKNLTINSGRVSSSISKYTKNAVMTDKKIQENNNNIKNGLGTERKLKNLSKSIRDEKNKNNLVKSKEFESFNLLSYEEDQQKHHKNSNTLNFFAKEIKKITDKTIKKNKEKLEKDKPIIDNNCNTCTNFNNTKNNISLKNFNSQNNNNNINNNNNSKDKNLYTKIKPKYIPNRIKKTINVSPKKSILQGLHTFQKQCDALKNHIKTLNQNNSYNYNLNANKRKNTHSNTHKVKRKNVTKISDELSKTIRKNIKDKKDKDILLSNNNNNNNSKENDEIIDNGLKDTNIKNSQTNLEHKEDQKLKIIQNFSSYHKIKNNFFNDSTKKKLSYMEQKGITLENSHCIKQIQFNKLEKLRGDSDLELDNSDSI